MGTTIDDLVLDLAGDEELKRRFVADPTTVLRERGFEVPEGVEFRVVEDTAKVRHLVLPHLRTGALHAVEEVGQRQSKVCL